jgi:toxin ParE1/3/4
MRILWTDQASEQLASAYDYVLAENPSAAEKQLEIVLRAVEQLANFPEMGRLGRVDGTRELVIQGTPYIVAYRLRGATVRVLALLHGARRWPKKL